MKCKYDQEGLANLVKRQINNYWEYDITIDFYGEECLAKTIKRLDVNLQSLKSKYISNGEETYFRVEHSVSYAVFLYILSNELYRAGKTESASYVYYLNKIMHSIDWFYAIELPEHFGAEHPLSSVLGKACYGDHFFIYQGCTVGGNRKNDKLVYPVIGDYVLMYANSTILGNAAVGDNVIVSANTFIKDEVIPNNCIVFGKSPSLTIKRKTKSEIDEMLKHIWK